MEEPNCTRLYFFHFEYLFSCSGYICGKVVYILKLEPQNLIYDTLLFLLLFLLLCCCTLCMLCILHLIQKHIEDRRSLSYLDYYRACWRWNEQKHNWGHEIYVLLEINVYQWHVQSSNALFHFMVIKRHKAQREKTMFTQKGKRDDTFVYGYFCSLIMTVFVKLPVA